jgi:HEPN domain-containing protein
LTPEELDEAERLLKAARSDLRAAAALAVDVEQENDVVGFHAQQAVEKSIKERLRYARRSRHAQHARAEAQFSER